MNSDKKNENQKDIERYLEENNVYHIFEDLLQSLIINKPVSPLDFLYEKLSQPQQKKIFIIGPTGSNAREISLELSDHLKFTCVSVGDLLKKEVSKKSSVGQEIENALKNFTYVKDEIVIDIVKKHLDQLGKDKSYILEGFPKTKQQGLALQKAGILPNAFIVLTMSDEKTLASCIEKINQDSRENLGDSDNLNYSHIPADNKTEIATSHAEEFKLHMSQLLGIYKNYIYKVDAEMGKIAKEEILEDVVRLIKYRKPLSGPIRPLKIIVMGPPSSGRTTLSREIAAKYGLIHVSTVEILRDFINKKGKLSSLVEDAMRNGELIPDEIIMTLLNERLSKNDCVIQGFILDGFPKNLNQIQSLEDLRIKPNFIVVLEGNEETLVERIDGKMDSFSHRILRWREVLKIVESTPKYSKLIFKTSCLCESKNVFEKVSFHIENS